MTISIGCDHAGFEYKDIVKQLLSERGIEIADFGTHSLDSVDYPDFAHPAASLVEEGIATLGILLCGSGNGVAMTANKRNGVRAALCWNKELAELARLHNNANMICIPVRFVDESTALDMVTAFLDTAFEGGRHGRRVDKIKLSC
ncbi:MAG: ribose 5-phosphate isomerase B [Maribacter sp.]|jgi:ribose 5-phosphate isomerase B